MLRISIITSGPTYQAAAAWAASTYAKRAGPATRVDVVLPEKEEPDALLQTHARTYGFHLERFPFQAVSERKFTSQLKCQAFPFCLQRLADGDLSLFVDADTYCLKPLSIANNISTALLNGKVGLVPDVKNRHTHKSRLPWYLAPAEQATYVNTGVILASRFAQDIFDVVSNYSKRPAFLFGPFNDQKVFNYVLGKFFNGRLLLLDRAYNGLRKYRSAATIIGHCAGGAGRFGGTRRSRSHLAICKAILNLSEPNIHAAV